MSEKVGKKNNPLDNKYSISPVKKHDHLKPRSDRFLIHTFVYDLARELLAVKFYRGDIDVLLNELEVCDHITQINKESSDDKLWNQARRYKNFLSCSALRNLHRCYPLDTVLQLEQVGDQKVWCLHLIIPEGDRP